MTGEVTALVEITAAWKYREKELLFHALVERAVMTPMASATEHNQIGRVLASEPCVRAMMHFE